MNFYKWDGCTGDNCYGCNRAEFFFMRRRVIKKYTTKQRANIRLYNVYCFQYIEKLISKFYMIGGVI